MTEFGAAGTPMIVHYILRNNLSPSLFIFLIPSSYHYIFIYHEQIFETSFTNCNITGYFKLYAKFFS